MAKEKKVKDDDAAPQGDHLKYYCVVFGVLVVVVGVVALMQRNKLNAYRAANQQARVALKATGTTSDGRPLGIGELAVEVEKFVQGYRASSGDGATGEGISNVRMQSAEEAVKVTREWAGREDDTPDQGKGFRTKSREFKYQDCTLEQLVTLVRNIEQLGRYRVYEMRWDLADAKLNSQPPHHLVSKPSIKVGFRTPLTKDR
ncbi:MAG: hypothetical protein O2894_04040 [Planctomycetota bacterium]|nr:hypothetical protein [Planctomycetota bacterium]